MTAPHNHKAGCEGDEGQVEPLDVSCDITSFMRKIKAMQKMGWGRGHDSSTECPGQPSASQVLGQGQLSYSVIHEEDSGHTEDGHKGGVRAAVVTVVCGSLKRSPPLLVYHRVY